MTEKDTSYVSEQANADDNTQVANDTGDKVEGRDSEELTNAINKLNNHLGALRRKGEATPEALEQIDNHIKRLEALKAESKTNTSEKSENEAEAKAENTQNDTGDANDTLASEVEALKQQLQASKTEAAVAKIVAKYGLSEIELQTIYTEDIEALEKRAQNIKSLVKNATRKKVTELPEDLSKSDTANRLLNS